MATALHEVHHLLSDLDGGRAGRASAPEEPSP
jgi:hypothetical protein